MVELKLNAVVALLEDLPAEKLVRGQAGTVVESWALGVSEVEFCDDDGRTYAMVALAGDRLLPLHHQPIYQTAYRFRSGVLRVEFAGIVGVWLCKVQTRLAIVYSGDDGRWVAECLSLPGCVSQV